MHHHVALQVVQPIELAAAHLAIELPVGIVILFMNIQVRHVGEALLADLADVHPLFAGQMRLLVLHETGLVGKPPAAIDARQRLGIRIVQCQVFPQRVGRGK